MNTGENEAEKVFTNWVDNLFACGRIGFSEMAIAKEMMYGWKEYLEESGVGKEETIWLTPEDKMADEESNEQSDDGAKNRFWRSKVGEGSDLKLPDYMVDKLISSGINTNEDLYFCLHLDEIFKDNKMALKNVRDYIEYNTRGLM